jgi:predicted nucleic acid-binding protein
VTEDANTVCVDASVIAKLLLPENDSPQARDLWSLWEDQGIVAHAPAYLVFEVSHAIRKGVRRGGLTREEGDRALHELLRMPLRYIDFAPADVEELWNRFVDAFDHLVTPYDAGYLYVADMLDCDLWTADERLVNTVGDGLSWVRSLSQHSPEET